MFFWLGNFYLNKKHVSDEKKKLIRYWININKHKNKYIYIYIYIYIIIE